MKIEQIAVPVSDIDQAIEFHGGHWIRDHVRAQVMYPIWDDIKSDEFECSLAFNYSLISGVEFELIHFAKGETIQTLTDVRPRGHQGYHTDKFVEEVQKWVQGPFRIGMIARTFQHTSFDDRCYMYALVDTRDVCGIWTKVISRTKPGLLLTKKEVASWIS